MLAMMSSRTGEMVGQRLLCPVGVSRLESHHDIGIAAGGTFADGGINAANRRKRV
jgi:hypothetical protein